MLHCFEDFLRVLSSLMPPRHLFQQDISFTDVSNTFGRYKLWCSNVGAAHDGPSYRLSWTTDCVKRLPTRNRSVIFSTDWLIHLKGVGFIFEYQLSLNACQLLLCWKANLSRSKAEDCLIPQPNPFRIRNPAPGEENDSSEHELGGSQGENVDFK